MEKQYSIDSVFSFVTSHIDIAHYNRLGPREKLLRYEFDGDMMKPWSLRYFVFILRGTQCVTCGLKASYFLKEKAENSTQFHFNLYGTNSSGGKVMFTKDHHIPKSKGGKDSLDNLVTMCRTCNTIKNNTVPDGPLQFISHEEFPTFPYEEWVGMPVEKISGKPFKCGEKRVITSGITINPHTGKQAFIISNSVVDCFKCKLAS